MADLVPFVLAVGAFAAVGILAGILIARRIDAWDASRDVPTDDQAEDDQP